MQSKENAYLLPTREKYIIPFTSASKQQTGGSNKDKAFRSISLIRQKDYKHPPTLAKRPPTSHCLRKLRSNATNNILLVEFSGAKCLRSDGPKYNLTSDLTFCLFVNFLDYNGSPQNNL